VNVIACEQRTDEWHQQRCGRITASRFGDVMTAPKTKADREAGKLSQTAETYLLEKLAEKLTGVPVNLPANAAMKWGTKWEPDALAVYQDVTGYEVQQVGFVVSNVLQGVGCSPDGLVYEKGMVQFKCPYNPAVHLKTVRSLAIPREYVPQVQGEMWVADREWSDFVSYDPRQPLPQLAMSIVRVERDDKLVGELERACRRFLDKLEEVLETLAGIEPVASEAHRIAHLCVPPITLTFDGEEIAV